MARWWLSVLALGLALPAQAKPYQCMGFGMIGIERPAKPSCVILPFSGDENAFSLCRSEMDSYKSQVQSYLDCLKAESDDAVSEFNATVASFNCNARGSYC